MDKQVKLMHQLVSVCVYVCVYASVLSLLPKPWHPLLQGSLSVNRTKAATVSVFSLNNMNNPFNALAEMSPASSREFPEFEQNTYSVTVVSGGGGTF